MLSRERERERKTRVDPFCSNTGGGKKQTLPGRFCSCKLTLAASIGLRAMSAKNSADADAAKYSAVLYTYEFSSPIMSEYFTLNTSYRPNLHMPCENTSPSRLYTRVGVIHPMMSGTDSGVSAAQPSDWIGEGGEG